MSYGSMSSSFKPKEKVTEDMIRKYLETYYDLDEDSELASFDTYSVITVGETGNVFLEFSDEVGSEDFDNIENEWKEAVKQFADFTDGAVHVTGDYENDDGEKSDINYHIGPKHLVTQAEIKNLEKERDRIEDQIAQKRRELSSEG
jgi:hypothetical protein